MKLFTIHLIDFGKAHLSELNVLSSKEETENILQDSILSTLINLYSKSYEVTYSGDILAKGIPRPKSSSIKNEWSYEV